MPVKYSREIKLNTLNLSKLCATQDVIQECSRADGDWEHCQSDTHGLIRESACRRQKQP